MIEIGDAWKIRHGGAAVGVLVMRGAENPPRSADLDAHAQKLESELRERWAQGDRQALRKHPVISAYEAYYRQFRKTYHVTLQLESVIWKGRNIPSVSAIVKAMFMAELSNMLLTAGHDLARVALPIRIDAGKETETYTALGGEPRAVKEGDMRISDADSVISSIIGGPDQRTSISSGTRDVLFTVYAPAGIGEPLVRAHLADIERLVKIIAPRAVAEGSEVVRAG